MAIKADVKKIRKPGKVSRPFVEEKLKYLKGLTPSHATEDKIAELEITLARMKRGRTAKQKGGSFERTVAKKFQKQYGVELVRTPQSGGFVKKSDKAEQFRGDIITVDKDIKFKLHIEAKNQKTWSLNKWLEQAEEDAPQDTVPMVIFHRHDSNRDFVAVSLEDFFKLVPKNKIMEELQMSKVKKKDTSGGNTQGYFSDAVGKVHNGRYSTKSTDLNTKASVVTGQNIKAEETKKPLSNPFQSMKK